MGGSLDDAPAIRIVDALLAQAFRATASDIHIESVALGLRVRYRQDGLLRDIVSILGEYALQVIARIKVLARLDVAEKRVPQDGKFIVEGPSGSVDIRVATFPGIYGEKVVLRILGMATTVRTIQELGCSPVVAQQLEVLLRRAHGFVIVTGPTGSGKTTTLYTLLSRLATDDKNLVTLEDPVEYTIEGTTQGQVMPEIGFDFAQGIRALLRQDPDVIMVGEMRDSVTAQTAVQAALTGHMVLSTLHTADAPGALIRLIDMGIPPFLVGATITGVIAQRLVRILCASCAQLQPLSAEEQEYCATVGVTLDEAYRAQGCIACNRTGYHGRVALFELLVMSPQILQAMQGMVHYEKLAAAVQQQGMQTLLEDGFAKVKDGKTSVAELMRVIG